MYKKIRIIILFTLVYNIIACDDSGKHIIVKQKVHPVYKNHSVAKPVIESRHELISQTEKTIIDEGLIDVTSIDSTIVIDMKYSTPDNFLGMDVYGDFDKCYLQPDVAEKLKSAQQVLKSKFPFYSLVVFDAVRPRSVQCKMWDSIAVSHLERSKYVSNPRNGSLHNYGAAVDVSIIDENHIELDMGTPYDYFGELAYPREEERLIKEGRLSHLQLLNRELLREVMLNGGFWGITTEWWHFNSCSRNTAAQKYKIME